jgi:bacterial microcompartment shell protein
VRRSSEGKRTIEAIGLVEIESIAAGVEVADAMVKMAPIEVLDAFMVTPGKYVVLVHGDPSSVQSSVDRGRIVAGDTLIDSLVIPGIDTQVLPALRHEVLLDRVDAVGLVETSSIAAGIYTADDAAKAAEVQLVHLVLGRGIGGKSMLLLSGELDAVQAAVEAAGARAARNGRLVATRIIPQPHDDLVARLGRGLERLETGPRAPTAPVEAD